MTAIAEVGASAALLLDSELRVLAATRAAISLLGEVPIGISAAQLLSGRAGKGAVATALAAGRGTQLTIPQPGGPDGQTLRVSIVPLGTQRERIGCLLLLQQPVQLADRAVDFHGMWSRDPAMLRMFGIIEKVARTDASVLVRGETGSGKELVANAIHQLSPRKSGPFRAINCAAMPASLLESELFGHTRGAFTGAVRDTPGHFKLANGGTLFLDEIGELSLDLQSKLLRVLETHTVMPIGASKSIPVDVRIVTATHRAIRKDVAAGRFRADLMYRLRVIPIFIPPLRARGTDVVMLAERIIEEMNARASRQVARISPGAQSALSRYAWPGNVRELRNALEYAFAIGEGTSLVESDLPPEVLSGESEDGSREPDWATAALPSNPIVGALERAHGNRVLAAKSLGMSRSTLWRRMKQLGLIEPTGS